MIKVLFFAHLRELAGCADLILEPSEDVTDMPSLLQAMAKHLPAELIDALSDESAMVSVNHQYAGWQTTLRDGDEVGLLPPVSGG